MFELAFEHYRNPGKLFKTSGSKGDYWIRKSASKGNIIAIKFIEKRWGQANPKEVIHWLEKGIEFNHPWCAEQLAIGYKYQLYELRYDEKK